MADSWIDVDAVGTDVACADVEAATVIEVFVAADGEPPAANLKTARPQAAKPATIKTAITRRSFHQAEPSRLAITDSPLFPFQVSVVTALGTLTIGSANTDGEPRNVRNIPIAIQWKMFP